MKTEKDSMISLPVLGNLTYREWHAFINGLYKGAVEGGRKHEYDKEKHYWRAGYLLSAGGRYAALIALVLA